MKDKKPKVLDIFRLIIAILILVVAILVMVSLCIAVREMFTDDEGMSGLVFLFIIPVFIGAVVYAIVGIMWIRKYFKVKNKVLSERKASTAEPIIKSIIAGIFLKYISIPFIVYWIFDLIEGIKYSNWAKNKVDGPEFKTNETHPISSENKCQYCGMTVDYKYAKFCEHCGAEIEFRK
jgi:uncharacterized membrane protein